MKCVSRSFVVGVGLLWLSFSPSLADEPAREEVRLPGNISQGAMVIGVAPAGATIVFEGESLAIAPNGQFVFGFGRDAGPSSSLDVRFADGSAETIPVAVAPRTYDVQRISGLPPTKVTPPPERQARLARERGMVAKARKQFTETMHWAAAFVWPAQGRVTGVYGSQRVLNDIPKRPHFGLDVAGPVGTPVYAPAGGQVVLAEADFYYEGGIVIIDHGFGVMSTMFHMNSVDIEPGAMVNQGELVGTIGATGRATGPHVDWRINWNGRRLDPRFLVGEMPAKQPKG
jgi:murein DD-endopeptidase MepM/ murein hydrolase activator NlpD